MLLNLLSQISWQFQGQYNFTNHIKMGFLRLD